MAWAYVKSGGTATGTAGKYGTQKTGSWSTAFSAVSEYYGDLASCTSAAGLTDGDYILVSDLHDFQVTLTGSRIITANSNIRTISVDDDDVTVPSVGAKETYNYTGASTYYIYNSCQYVYGMTFEVSSRVHLRLAYTNMFYPESYKYHKCTFIAPSETSYTRYVYFTYACECDSCTFNFGTNSAAEANLRTINIESSYTYSFLNCTFITSNSSATKSFLSDTSPGHIYFEACDLSQMNMPVISTTTSAYYGASTYTISRCLEATNTRAALFTPFGGYFRPSGFFASGANGYSGTLLYNQGKITGTSSVYRQNGATDGVTSFSYYVTGNSTIENSNFLRFKLLDLVADTSSSKTFTIEIAQDNAATALTDMDVAMELLYSDDSTSKAHFQTTEKVFGTPVNLSTSSVTWTGLTNPTKQYLSITTTNTGKEGLCSVWLKVFKPSATFYVCVKVDVT
jgi:hypothetical protein